MSEWKQLYAEVLDREPPASLTQRVLVIAANASAADDAKTGWTRRIAIGVVAAAAVAVVLFVLALAAHSRSSAPEPAKPIPTLHPAANGLLALDSYRRGWDIFLMRPGDKPRRLGVAGAGATAECPAFSPDGTRLLFGRLTKSGDAQLVIAPVDSDGATGSATVIPLGGFHTLHGFDHHPCGTWSPDGRWVATAGTGAVWVVNTQTGAISRLPNLRPSDLEWRPGSDELAIAGDMGTDRGDETQSTPVTIYSTSTGERRRLGDVIAANVTWSPDGKTLAYTRGEDYADPLTLRLVDADGSHNRLLIRDTGGVNHGIGPVWSPRGDRIVYQRLIPGRGEAHNVVLVNVADGTTRVIAPPWLTRGSQRLRWVPDAVWWAPDGKTLLWTAWADEAGVVGGALIALPADRPADAKVLTAGLGAVPYSLDHAWAPIQMWGRQPASASATASAAIRTTGGWQVIDQGRCVNGTQLSFGAQGTVGDPSLSLMLDIPPTVRATGGYAEVTDGQLVLASGATESLVGRAVIPPGGNGGAFNVRARDARGHPTGPAYAGAWTCQAGHPAQHVTSQANLPRCTRKELDADRGVSRNGYRLQCGPGSAIVWLAGRWQVVSAGNCYYDTGIYFGIQDGRYPRGADPHRTLWFNFGFDGTLQSKLVHGGTSGAWDGEIDLPAAHTAVSGNTIIQPGGAGGAFDLNNRGAQSEGSPRADYVGAWTCRATS